jgi:long-chain acyl-CoA synthetase
MLLPKVLEHARRQPDAVALVDDQTTWTYGTLAHVAHRWADALAERVQPGEHVGVLVPPTAAFAGLFLALRWIGAVPVPLNYLLKPNELAGILRDAEVKLLVTVPPLAPLAQGAANGLPVVLVNELPVAPPSPGATLRPLPDAAPDDVMVIMYTSGTSGVPKGVMLTHKNVESDALNSCAHARFNEQTVFLGIVPMFHTLGLLGNLFIPLMLGSKVVYLPRFTPAGVFTAVQEHGVKVLIAVPSMYALLAHSRSATGDELKTVTLAVCGGEPLPLALKQGLKATFGIDLMEGFGLTETSPILALNVPWATKDNSVGQLIPETEVRVVGHDGSTVAAGADGLLLFRGPQVMKGYWKKPTETAEVLSSDGWFDSGDIGHVDAEGFLFITGRKKEMIAMAGEKIFPREIEEAIKTHPAVVLAAVIGAKDPTRGEVPVGFIQLKPDLPADQKPTENALRSYLRERIAAYKVPRDIYFIDEMPKSSTGKILKRELVGMLEKGETAH